MGSQTSRAAVGLRAILAGSLHASAAFPAFVNGRIDPPVLEVVALLRGGGVFLRVVSPSLLVRPRSLFCIDPAANDKSDP